MFLEALVVVLVVDGIWLTLNKGAYGTLVQGVQGRPLQLNMWGAALSYLCMILAIVYFAVPLARTVRGPAWKGAWLYGGTLGLLIYGIFNATNLAIFHNYTWTMALRDTLWGGILFAGTTWILTR
jgi:uncharacterized membrane protein